MAVNRRYFRYDVTLAMHMEPVDEFGKPVKGNRRELISREEELQLESFNVHIEEWLEKVFDKKSSALFVFYMLNHRLNFIWWLLDHLIESEDPRQATDFKFRCREDKKFKKPTSRKDSSIAPLILGFFDSIDSHIQELLGVVDNSLEGKVFIYSNPKKTLFNDKDYVKNLQELAQRGVLPAKVLQLLIQKLNLLETVSERLKEAYRQISQPEEWSVYEVNLSAGGFSLITEQPMKLFSQMDIFMDIEQEVMICRGKIISAIPVKNSDKKHRIGVQFDLLTSEQQEKITLFEQRQELRDAMQLISKLQQAS